jgi:hypothetical protein
MTAVLAVTPVRRLPLAGLGVPAAVLAWIPAVLLLDVRGGLASQRLLGLGTWLLLAALLRRESRTTTAQVAVVVAFATLVEYTFSAGLGVYTYRLDNVPSYVPPGHGLVYLGALTLARSLVFTTRARLVVGAVLFVGGVYAGWGLLSSSRPDALGALWFGCLLAFCWKGSSPLVYAGAFVVVTYLELLGTGLGAWTWATHDPTGLLTIGNPPSGAAGGYAFFDAAALAAAPWLAGRLRLAR